MATENVNVPEHQAEFIRQAVDSGRYQDASEVVRAGLHLLEEWLTEEGKRQEELRGMLEEAKACGVSDHKPEEAWAAVEARYQKEDA